MVNRTINKKEKIMDTSKYKSVATKLDTYNKAKLMAENTHRSIGSYISMVIDEAWKKQKPTIKSKLNNAAQIIFGDKIKKGAGEGGQDNVARPTLQGTDATKNTMGKIE